MKKRRTKAIMRCLSSTHLILLGFLSIILIGSVLLSLPVSRIGTARVPYVDSLFTAVSATCVTGLLTMPLVSTFSFFGQAVILLLIQIGGLGVITLVTGVMLMLNKRIGIDNRILIQDSFSLNSMSGIIRFIKKVIAGTFIIEGIGALFYMLVFVPEFGVRGIWISIFNSVSAFCNAGMDVIAENSLCDYATNPIVNLTTAILVILGGLGFPVWWDVIGIIRDKKRRHFRFLTLHSKLALSTTAVLLFVGTVLILVLEYNNPATIKDYSFAEKLMVSFFQSVTTRTAGFATIAQESLKDSSALLSIILMFIGGSPAGTAGGIKTVTFLILLSTMFSVVKNQKSVNLYNRQISESMIKKASAVVVAFFTVTILATFFLSAVTDAAFLDVLYETVSATATVGLTRNLTSTLNIAGKLIIITAMYFGRVGPISIAVAFNVRKNSNNCVSNPVENIMVG